MWKQFLNTNFFIFSVGLLQALGAIKFLKDGSPKFALLYFLYALTNFVLWACKGE